MTPSEERSPGSSSYSTGGGGTVLEHRYGAVLLVHLLTGDPVPQLGDDVTPISVHFQASAISPVDDLFVVGRTPDGGERRISIGVRRSPSLVRSDDASIRLVGSYLKVVIEHWEDVETGRWRLGLAVASPRESVRQLRRLAEIARTTAGNTEFRAKVKQPGRTSRGVRARLGHLDGVVETAIETERIQTDVDPAVLTWRFLSGLQTSELRLEDDETDRTVAVARLQTITRERTPEAADRLFAQLAELSGQYAPAGADVTTSLLRRDLSGTPLEVSASSRPKIAGSTEELRTVVAKYLGWLENWLSRPPRYLPPGLDVAKLGRGVVLSSTRKGIDDAEQSEREAARRAGTFAADEARRRELLTRAYRRPGPHEDLRSHESRGLGRLVHWDDTRSRFRRAVILGDPGFGKTWLLRWEGRLIAARERDRLVSDRPPLEELELPVYVRLSQVARDLTGAEQSLRRVIVEVAAHDLSDALSYREIELLCSWAEGHLADHPSTLLLDGLDEVPSRNVLNAESLDPREVLIQGLGRLDQATPGRILLTSRLAGYFASPLHMKGGPREAELELLEFAPGQVREFVNVWFERATATGHNLLARLETEPALAAIARIPLLLSFLCLLAGEGQTLPSRRTELYDRVVRSLLNRPWQDREPLPYEEERRRCLRLESVGWHFATAGGRWRDLLPRGELMDLLHGPHENAGGTGPTKSVQTPTDGDLAVARELLAPAGNPADPNTPYLFAHRTLHEYLVAHHLSRWDERDVAEHLRKHLWFDADWAEVIPLVAGCLEDENKDPDVLLGAMETQKDALHSLLILAANCAAEVTRSKHKQRLTRKLEVLLFSKADGDKERALRSLLRMGGSALPILDEAMRTSDYKTQELVAEGLARFGHADALAILERAVRHGNEWRRLLGVLRLSRLGASRPLIDRALEDDNILTMMLGVDALASHGPAAVPILERFLDHDEPDVRLRVAECFAQIGLAALDRLAVALRTGTPVARETAAAAVAEMGQPETLGLLQEAIADPDEQVRLFAAQGLAAFDRERATKVLEHLLTSGSWSIRLQAAKELAQHSTKAVRALAEGLDGPEEVQLEAVRALARVTLAPATPLARDEALEVLTRALVHQDANVRLEAAAALAGSGNAGGLSLLETTLHERSPARRVEAVRALARIPDRRAVELLEGALEHRDVAVQVEAANALAKQGDVSALDKLEEGLNDERPTVRLAARTAIVRLPRAARDEVLPEVVSLALKMWASHEELRVQLYESLLDATPRLYWQVGDDEWPEWCDRLQEPTSWMWALASESADSADS